MPRISLGKIVQLRPYVLLRTKVTEIDKVRCMWEVLKRKNREKLHEDGRPKC